jgi:hypothetical protein
MLKFKPKAKADASAFESLVRDRTTVERELRLLDSPRGFKLSASAFLKEAMAIAQSNSQRLAKLREALQGDSSPATQATLRKMTVFIRSNNCSQPTRDIGRLNFLTTPNCLIELLQLGHTTFELFALSALIAGESHAESFGEAESSSIVRQRIVELGLRRDELNEKIATSFSAADLSYDSPDAQGKALVYFRLTAGKTPVPVHPAGTAGQRLADWILQNENVISGA